MKKPTKETVIEFKALKDQIAQLTKQLRPLEKQLKEYCKENQNGANYRGVSLRFKLGESMRFNKDLFLESNSEAVYNSYKVASESVSIIVSIDGVSKKAA